MKKYTAWKVALLLGLLLNCMITAYGQSRRTNFGFKGGLNQSDVNATEINGSKTGYTGTEIYGGFFADTRLSNKFRLGNELLFSFTDDYHFIELPLHFKYKIVEKWNVLLGPKLDYIIDSDDAWINFKQFGVSGEIGSQYRINSLFFAEVRYARSFTSQINSDGLDFYNGKRNTFRVGLGINFLKPHTPGEKLGPMRLRAGLSAGVPLTNGYDIVAGGDLRLQTALTDKLSGILSAGYSHYSLEDKEDFEETNIAYLPVKLGLKVFPVKNFYIAPEMGIAIGTKSEAYTYPFIYAAGIGVEAINRIDLSLRYERMTGRIHDYLNEIKRPGQLALRMEYVFNLNSKKSKSLPDTPPAALTGKRRKTVYAEGLGNGVGVSGNFDIRLKPDRNDGFGVSAGAGIVGTYLTLPVTLNYIVGKNRSGFETGIGVTPIINFNPAALNRLTLGNTNYISKFSAAALINAGYRLQSRNGFMLRANASAIYLDRLIAPLPGLAIGYNFK